MGKFDYLRQKVHQHVITEFQHGWQWICEFDAPISAPVDFDVYCKEIEHGSFDIEYEDKRVGSQTLTTPTNKSAGDITLTIRDHVDTRCERFFKSLARLVVNSDGTVNLPVNYLMTMRLYLIDHDGNPRGGAAYRQYRCSVSSIGTFTRSRESGTEFVSYPVTFKLYSSRFK